mmetsp:Transcript_22063/g.61825  ORF Transcript_22063/g.61825 Transcript_22063/m.61825 type:complete len:91 (+) Transcript_22063:76-348(+)
MSSFDKLRKMGSSVMESTNKAANQAKAFGEKKLAENAIDSAKKKFGVETFDLVGEGKMDEVKKIHAALQVEVDKQKAKIAQCDETIAANS